MVVVPGRVGLEVKRHTILFFSFFFGGGTGANFSNGLNMIFLDTSESI